MSIQQYQFKNIKIDILLNFTQLQPKQVQIQMSYKDSTEQIYKITQNSFDLQKQQNQWITNYKAVFQFHKFQCYHLDISINENVSVGSIQFQLGELLQKGTLVKTNNHFTINLEAVLLQKGTLLFQHWAAEKLLNTDGIFGKSDPFLKFYQWDDDQWNLVYVTEYIQNNLNPTWNSFSIDMGLLNFYDEYKKFKIECFDHSDKNPPNHKYIGSIELSYFDILQSPNKKFELSNPNHKFCGILKQLSIQIKQKDNFYTWLQNKQIQTLIFMEFSKSSYNLHQTKSYDQLNIFQQILIIIGPILIQYNKQNTASLYGFGGNIHENNEEFFQISNQQNGIQQICHDYSNCRKYIPIQNNIQITPCLFEIIKQTEIFKPNFTIGIILIQNQIQDVDKFKQFLENQLILPTIIIFITLEENFVEIHNIVNNDLNLSKVKSIQLKQSDVQGIHQIKDEILQMISNEIEQFYGLN
ncbi:unnamed protein product [Paramecium sonneborni]|uniref:C2 domain-containing protein n=1 Tax=Paramecium sonneborni TaxID=65129 RepID=A0A8S1NUW3_9CILI|nr:unnamed protein product [Paramecium sonneborni]